MNHLKNTLAARIAKAASARHKQWTGHLPASVSVVLGEDTLVITLHGALSPAEKILAQTPAGAAQVQEFHRQLFATSSDALSLEIMRIAGVQVLESAAETVVQAFASGTIVQVFHLARRLSPEASNAIASTLLIHVVPGAVSRPISAR